MRLSEAIEQLAIATQADGRRPRTVQSYREKLGHLVRFLGDVPIEVISIADLRGYMAHLWDRDLSPFTIKGRARALKRLWNFAQAEGIVEDNPAQRIKVPRPRRTVPKGIETDDFLALLETTQEGTPIDLRDRAIIMFLFDTGCRAGGLCGLEVDHLGLDAMLATVTEKGGRARFVPFTELTREALQKWLDVRPSDRGLWVFVGLASHSKGALTPNSLYQMLAYRAAKAGCKGPVNPHAFRHAFARNYLMREGDLATLAKLLGNSIEIVAEYYAIFSIGELQKKHRQHSTLLAVLGDNGNE